MWCYFINCAENISIILLEISLFLCSHGNPMKSPPKQCVLLVSDGSLVSHQCALLHKHKHRRIIHSHSCHNTGEHGGNQLWCSYASHHTCFTFQRKQCFWALMENRCFVLSWQDEILDFRKKTEHCYCKTWYLWLCICKKIVNHFFLHTVKTHILK